MLKKIFIFTIIAVVVFTLVYQRRYVISLKNKSDKLHIFSTEKQIVAEGFGFQNFSYNQDGSIKSVLSSDKIIYYQDASVLLEGKIQYQEYNKKLDPVLTVQTERGLGKFESPNDQQNSSILSGRQLSWLKLPGDISFNLNGNQGTTKNVFIDVIKRTISSDEHIHSTGPDGNISADGFFYDIDNKEFTLNSKVRGTYKPPKQDRK